MAIGTKLKTGLAEVTDIWNTVSSLQAQTQILEQRQRDMAMMLGQLLTTQVQQKGKTSSLAEVEFKVFSQFGQDGILQYLVHHIPIPHPIFVEFGVQTYFESTTRFLLMQNRWSGLVMDGNKDYMEFLSSTDMYWQYDLTSKYAFITKENINQLISDYTDEEDIGLLVVDIDGNDYWVWQAIDVIKPRIVVCEYNPIFGPDKALTVPYDPEFVKSDGAHYGASLTALALLAKQKGYGLIGCNSAGNDAFFVRKDLVKSPLKEVTAKQAFVQPKFRGAYRNRHAHWRPTQPLFDVAKGKVIQP